MAVDGSGNNIIFGECKYWSNKVGVDVLNALEYKSRQVEWKRGMRKEYFILFAVNGFTDELMELEKGRGDLILIN